MRWTTLALFGLAALLARPALAEGRALRGRVVDADGAPVSGVTVALAWTIEPGKAPEPIAPVATDNDGHFAITPPARGLATTLLAIDTTNARGAVATVRAEQRHRPVTLALGPLVSLRGKALLEGSNVFPFGLEAWLAHGDDPTQAVKVHFDRSTFDVRIPAGTWTVTIRSQQCAAVTEQVALTADAGDGRDVAVELREQPRRANVDQLAPPLPFRELSSGAKDLLSLAHFPPRWTIYYYFDYT
ncbi:MAG: carboxypeptidase-like regulatory domain-containing protein [Planctomycetota bacterium]